MPKSNNNAISIDVQDTGIGIAPDSIDRIFEPFQQEDTSESRKYEGIGLGLAIARAVTRQQGGSIKVDSVQGTGSTFSV